MLSRLISSRSVSSASRSVSMRTCTAAVTQRIAMTIVPCATSRTFHSTASTQNIGGGYMQTGQLSPSSDNNPRILVTGAVGQIGSELVSALRARYGRDNVVASDIKSPSKESQFPEGPFVWADVMNMDVLARVILEHRVDWVVHLASLLSAIGEQNPALAMKLNTRGIENVLELARQNNLRVFAPSTIAAFGPSSPRDNTPDSCVMRPTTIYGVTKVYLELLGEYYNRKFGVDFRSVRYPGIISSLAMPGGGTTDYAVDIYHQAIQKGEYTCFLKEDTRMPMMYMPDCIDAVIQLMEADNASLTQRTYNVTGFSFTPAELTQSIQKEIPNFNVSYRPDFRQQIADTWPRSLDDSKARQDWNWAPKFTIDTMTKDMLQVLKQKYSKPTKANSGKRK